MQPVIILKKRGDYSLEANFGPEVNFVSALMKAAHNNAKPKTNHIYRLGTIAPSPTFILT